MLIMDQKGSKLTASKLRKYEKYLITSDQDKDNTLDGKEFKDARASASILEDDEVQSLYIKLTGGAEKKMNFEGFSDFMYDQLKTGASLEDVMNAFANLAYGEIISQDAIKEHFSPHGDVADYFGENMPDGEYKSFTTSCLRGNLTKDFLNESTQGVKLVPQKTDGLRLRLSTWCYFLQFY